MFLGLVALFGLYGLTLGSPVPLVDTPLGPVLGWERSSRDGRTYQAWTGIPFAQPPTGELRFKAPRPAEKWQGVLNATGDAPMCLQSGFGEDIQGSEDCLFLNVYRPKTPDMKQMPVVVYLYGGGFIGGDTGAREGADYIMDEDVVLVTTNYRVGILGFASLGDKEFPGNFGVKDTVMALRWIKRNIAAFGGDPESVTVFGPSAGGMLSHYLLKAPICDEEELLTRAMSDSGSINHQNNLKKASEVAATTNKVAEITGCNKTTTAEILACLREVNATTLLEAFETSESNVGPIIEPVEAEDAVITEDLSLRPSMKPWITRYSNGEWVGYFEMENQTVTDDWYNIVSKNLTGYLTDWVGQYTTDEDKKAIAASRLEKLYFPVISPMENFTIALSKVQADNSFTYPALFNIMNHQGPKWIARFEYHSKLSERSPPVDDTLAQHAEEGFYYFHDPSINDTLAGDVAMSKLLIKYLVNFAYHSDPTPFGSPTMWPQFTNDRFDVLRTTPHGEIMADDETVKRLKEVLDVWYYTIGWK